MKILFTGASSFTGSWFSRALAEAGHEVTATFQGPRESYQGLRGTRVEQVTALCRPVWNCPFGSDAFLGAIRDGGPWDLLCHHGAQVTNYKSWDFDVTAAVASNTLNLAPVLDALVAQGLQGVVATGTVFEAGEGEGTLPLRAFSPYGLSKTLNFETIRFWAATRGVTLGKFVIPNPFGPFEEPRFTSYLVRCWMEGKTAGVQTPDYVRDNIHVDLLASQYRLFTESLPADGGVHRCAPRGYVETQGEFAQRFAAMMQPRLGVPCEVSCGVQKDFSEPLARANTGEGASVVQWDEDRAWDGVASYYLASLRAALAHA